MKDYIDKIDINKIKKETDEYVFELYRDFLGCMNWSDSKLENKITVREALQMFSFIMANLMMTINSDFETYIAGMTALAERTKDLEYTTMKNLYFITSMLKFGPKWREAYKEYSEEFDALNRDEKIGEDASVEVETETEDKGEK